MVRTWMTNKTNKIDMSIKIYACDCHSLMGDIFNVIWDIHDLYPIVLVYDRKHKGLEEDDPTIMYYNNLSVRKKWLC